MDDKEPLSASLGADELLAAQAKAKRTRIAVAAVLGVVVIAGGVAVVVSLNKSDDEAAGKPFSELSACLVGEPLAPNEKPSARVRNTQLAAMATPQFGKDTDWPDRCAKHAHAMAENLRKIGKDSPLAAAAEKLAKAMKVEHSAAVSLSKEVDELWAEADKAKIKASPVTGSTPPPKSEKPLTIEALQTGSRLVRDSLALTNIFPEPFHGAQLRFVVDQRDHKEGPLLCTTAASSPALTCQKIVGPVSKFSPGIRLWGTTDDNAKPLLFVGNRGTVGIFRSDTGQPVVESAGSSEAESVGGLRYGAYGASSLADGSVQYVGWSNEAPQVRLYNALGDGRRYETKLIARSEMGNPYYSTAVLWDWFFLKAYTKQESDGIRLLAMRLPKAPEAPAKASASAGAVISLNDAGIFSSPEGGAPTLPSAANTGTPGAIEDLGEVGRPSLIEREDYPHISGCKSVTGDLVVRVKGDSSEYFSFRIANKWTPPTEASGISGALTCHGAEASITRTEGAEKLGRFWGLIEHTRCNPTACTPIIIELKDMLQQNDAVAPVTRDAFAAADIDGKLLAVWSAGDSGGIRYRMAAPEAFAKAEDTILFDDHVEDGVFKQESSVTEMRLLPANGFALVFLRTLSGVYVFRINSSGKAAQLNVEKRG